MVEECPVSISIDGIILGGSLCIPKGSTGIVVFAHGSGSSRFSPRNTYVAGELRKAGLATLLFDLLTAQEEKLDDVTGQIRFDIELLAERLVATTDWLRHEPKAKHLKIGYFGASTGAAAALVAASVLPEIIKAVVSRGGRPDLAGRALPAVKAPTLLIVGGFDTQVIALNKSALAQLKWIKKMEIVPGATHLFEEPGTLDKAAGLAEAWFLSYVK
jgi:putative phosphoribosyl transferase